MSSSSPTAPGGSTALGGNANAVPAHASHYPQGNSLVFVVNPLPSTEEQLNERILESADRLRNQSTNTGNNGGAVPSPAAAATTMPVMFFSNSNTDSTGANTAQSDPSLPPPPHNLSTQTAESPTGVPPSVSAPEQRPAVLQCVISNGYVAVLLEDHRVCRFQYNIYPERMGTNSGDTTSSKSLSTSTHRLNSPSNSSLVSSNSARTVQTARRRLIRSSSRPRTSASVIMSRGHVIPAQFVPEDLINQAQVVLQGKSRNVIIRELQRTNLDVNLAVNNLLSRDDEEFDDADDGPEQMIQSDDLMSLLDSGFPNDSVIIDSDFADEVFSYPLRIRSSSALFNGGSGGSSGAAGAGGSSANGTTGSTSGTGSRPSRLRDDAFSFIERDIALSGNSGSKSRWYSYNVDGKDGLGGGSRSAKNRSTEAGSAVQLAPISFYDQAQEFWPNASDKKFIAIASICSELIALTASGQLCQWRWQDVEPFKGQLSDGTVYYHPKVPSLGLLQEKVTLLSASCIRATVATESGKLATWIDESIAPIASKLEHAATSSLFTDQASGGASSTTPSSAVVSLPLSTPPSSGPPPQITSLYVSSLMSVVQLSTGALFWWGIPPFSHRKKLIEKVKNERSKSGKSKSSGSSTSNTIVGGSATNGTTTTGTTTSAAGNTTNAKDSNEIVEGSLVCMRNSPIYQAGSIAFTTISGIPKVGQLVNSAWKMTDSCSFRILTQAEIQSRLQPSGGSVLSLNNSSSSTQRPLTASTSKESIGSSSSAQAANSLSVDSKVEMPPPPSPASSTSSEPGYNAPLPKRPKRASGGTTGATASSAESKNDSGANAIDRVEMWQLKDVVFMEDVKNMPIGRVIKVDGNYVAVKFNHGVLSEAGTLTPGGSGSSGSSGSKSSGGEKSSGPFDFTFENYMQDCRLMRKDELSVLKTSPPMAPGSGVQMSSTTACTSGPNSATALGSKAYDCLQRYPKRVHIPEHVQILAMTLTNLGLHCIAKIGGYRFSYILINIVTGRIETDSKIGIEYNTFFGANGAGGSASSSSSSSSSNSKIKLYSGGESDATTVVLCRDGNGTLYPLARDCTETVIREPIALNLGPVSTIGLGIFALPSSMTGGGSSSSSSATTTKTHAAILGLAFEPQLLMTAILKSDLDLVRERLELLERYPHIYHPMIGELCDGNHNIIHIAVSACFPTTNKTGGGGGGGSSSSGIMNIFESDEVMSLERSPEPFTSSASNDQQPMDTTSGNSSSSGFDNIPEPLLDPSEQKPIAHSILWTLLDSPVLAGHLLDLLSSRDFQGHTPFMLAIAGRAYSAANQLFLIIQRLARQYAVANCGGSVNSAAYVELQKRTLLQMLYPRSSLPDHSPLYMLCSNDTCSFTWTGEEHINQDIFECRTCGLVGSLCCCTECARVCHRGHDCKLKRTSPTAYCDCWEKCKCKALISGCQPARYLLLKRLLANTDLSLRVNSRGEHILLFLVQTVGRQIVEQKQYRPSRLRSSASRAKAEAVAAEDGGGSPATAVPEHDLEPPKFTRRALEKLLGDWPTVKSMILTGYRAPDSSKENANSSTSKRRSYLCGFFNGTSNAYAYEEENAYLGRQNGSALLDKFTHSLLRIGLEMIERLIVTLLMACNNQYPEARIVARRFVRSVARVGLVVCFELNPTLYANLTPSTATGSFTSLMDRALGGSGPGGSSTTSTSSSYSSSISSSALSKRNSALSILSKCRRIFLSFLPLAIEELCEVAESLIVPVKQGLARPSGAFVLSPTSNEVLASTDEIFSVDTSIYAHQRDFLDSAFGLEGLDEGGGPGAPPPPPPVVVPAAIPPAAEALPPVVPNNFVGAFGDEPRNVPAAAAAAEDQDQIEPMDTNAGSAVLNVQQNGADIVANNEDGSSEAPPSMDGSEVDAQQMQSHHDHHHQAHQFAHHHHHRSSRDDIVIIGEMLGSDEHDEENSNVGGRDTESDSESNPDDASYLSNADNASMAQRSVVTGATAGSDVGVSSLPYDDESVNSNGDDVDDDDDDEAEENDNEDDDDDGSDASDTAETENETEDLPFIDDTLEPRRSSAFGGSGGGASGTITGGSGANGSSRNNILHHVQWALRQRDLGGGGTSGSGSGSSAAESGFRRAVNNALVTGENVVSISTSAIGLARAFSIVIRQIGDLMPVLRNPAELNNSGFLYLAFTSLEAMALQNVVEERLKNTWEWLINAMDSTETQLRFGCALSNRRLTSTVSSSLTSTTSSSAAAAASISNAVAFSQSTTSAATNAATNSLRRLRAFQNHDDMLFLPSISRTTSALRRMSGLGIHTHSTARIDGTTGGSGASGGGASGGSVGGNASSATRVGGSAAASVGGSGSMDSNSARRDFLNYAMSLMRAHSNEHYDSLPVLDVASLKHLAYVFDAFVYYIRRGLVDSYQSESCVDYSPESYLPEKMDLSTATTDLLTTGTAETSTESSTGRGSKFFKRSNSTLYLGCLPPDPFSAPFHEALPLASKPHLLQPNARREQLFGVPRPSNAKQAEQMIESLPSQMSLTKRTIGPGSVIGSSSHTSSAFQTPTRNQSVISEPSTSGGANTNTSTTSSPSRSSIIQTPPTKQSVIVLAGSAKHPQLPKTEVEEKPSYLCSVIAKAAQYNAAHADAKPLIANHYYGNQEKHDSLLGRWRLSLELFGRLFVDDVGLEPSSIMGELSGFPIKETKFRREMERLRNPNSSSAASSNVQRDISFLKLDRDRGTLLQQTFKELNTVFSSQSRRITSNSSPASSHLAITRVKVTFKDEPGEGSGVARSFYTAFSEAALANEKLPALDWLVPSSTGSSTPGGRNASSFNSGAGSSSPYHHSSYHQFNLIRVANGSSISQAVAAAALANGSSGGSNSAGSGAGGASGNAQGNQGSRMGASQDDSLRRPRSPSRLRLFTTRRSHIERLRNELRSNAFGGASGGSGSGSSAGGTGAGAGSGASGGSSQGSRHRNNSGPIMRYDAPSFMPTQYVSLANRFSSSGSSSSSSSVIPTDSRITLGHRIYARVYPLHPNHAPKITGMLLELPSHDLIPIITSDEEFRNQVEHAMDIINAAESSRAGASSAPPAAAASASSAGSSTAASPTIEIVEPPQQLQGASANPIVIDSVYKTTTAATPGTATAVDLELLESEADDNAPLFYQPGPRGFYSPRLGRGTEARLNAFRNVGRIIGICFVQNELCPITFNRHVIKMILGRPVSWHDLAFFDSDLYESLRQLILDAESTNKEEIFTELDFRFAIDVAAEEGGAEVDLIPNGRNIRVTPGNVFNYVQRYAMHRMVYSQYNAIQAIRAGIFDVLPCRSFEGLTAEDFRLLLNGVNEINVQLLQSYVTFHDESGDGAEHLSYFRRWFWWVVERMTNEEKQDLIYFWTGSPALPASEEGFQPMPSITIRPRDDYYFVTANTCISRLYIPLYSSRTILRQKLLVSIKAKSFGFI